MTTHITVKEALTGVLSKSMSVEDAMAQLSVVDQTGLNIALIYVSEKLAKSGVHLSASGAAGMRSAFGGSSAPAPTPPPSTPVGKAEDGANLDVEVMKVDSKGQWRIEKAATEGPALNYKKINPKTDFADIEAKAPTYNKQTAITTPAKKEWTGAAQRTADVNAKLDAIQNESAIDAIKRRQGVKKEEGILEDKEIPAATKKTKMTIAKEDT